MLKLCYFDISQWAVVVAQLAEWLLQIAEVNGSNRVIVL